VYNEFTELIFGQLKNIQRKDFYMKAILNDRTLSL